jgi:hypothetical protein
MEPMVKVESYNELLNKYITLIAKFHELAGVAACMRNNLASEFDEGYSSVMAYNAVVAKWNSGGRPHA